MADTQSDEAPISAGDAFEIHRQMVIALFAATFVLSILLTIGLCITNHDPKSKLHVTALMVVASAGALGGFVSALRRLYAFQRVFPTNFFGQSRGINLYLVVYSMIPPLIGIIASVALYLIFAAGLISGDIFPKFHLSPIGTVPDDFQNFIANWQPILPHDYAKAIVWGFIAGFSERFVPNILGSLSSADTSSGDSGQRRLVV